jgi:hypothetical protein
MSTQTYSSIYSTRSTHLFIYPSKKFPHLMIKPSWLTRISFVKTGFITWKWSWPRIEEASTDTSCPLYKANSLVRFQVLTAASMKMAVFWVIAPCSLVEVYRRFRGACYQTTRRATTQKTATLKQSFLRALSYRLTFERISLFLWNR